MSTIQPQPQGKTPDLTPHELQNMSPAARDAYLQKKAEEGVDPNSWLWGPIQEILAKANAKQQSQQLGDQAENQATAGRDVQYVQGLQPSSADYMGNDHTQLKGFVTNNLDPQQVADVSTSYFTVHQAFDEFAKAIDVGVSKSKGTWEGPAAENAQAYFASLSKWSDANSQNARLASETTYDQSTAAQSAKNSMPEPIPFSWGDEFKSWFTSNPLNFADNIDKSIQKQKDSQAAHEQAANVMHTYDQSLYTAASKQPVFAEPPKFGTGGGDQPGTGDGNGTGDGSSGHRGSIGTGGTGGTSGTGGTGGIGGPASRPDHFVTSTPPQLGGGHTTGSSLPGTTTPSSFNPSSFTPPPPNSNQNLGGMPMAPMPMGGGGFGPGGEADYNSKIGRGGGFGPGGSGGGTASGSAAPGSGNASGAARPGGVGAAEAAAGRGMGGLGSRGASGMGGMGGAHGKGAKGEEDAEHQRPTYLVEGDPDEVFGTDMRTAPPVIGE